MAIIRPRNMDSINDERLKPDDGKPKPDDGKGTGTKENPIILPQGIYELRIKGSNFDSNAELLERTSRFSGTGMDRDWNRLPTAFLTKPLRLIAKYDNGIPVGLRAYKIVQNGLESNTLYIQVETDGKPEKPEPEKPEPEKPIINAVGANRNVFELKI